MNKKKKAGGKYMTHKKKSRKGLLLGLMVVAILAIGALLLLPGEEKTEIPETTVAALEESESTVATPAPTQEITTNLGYGIYLTDIGSYTGMYMEDGSDEILSGILMMVVRNDGDQDIQYAEITMEVGEQTASFSLTTLPVGEAVVLLEKNRMAYDKAADYDAILPKVDSVAYFQEPISTMEDKLKIGIVDGAVNVTNISGEDIAGDITVYYKNAADDIYYGGITYRFRIEGGLKADEIRQVMTHHASETGSKIMFATIAP